MTHWIVKRIDSQAGIESGLVCTDPDEPVQVTLEDTDTGNISSINICSRVSEANPCHLLSALATAGYTPNDWTTECP